MKTKWTPDQIPPQTDRTAVVTGADGGLGQVITRELARAGARVVMASRDPAAAAGTVAAIRAAVPSATVTAAKLDLADLGSVKAFSQQLLAGLTGVAYDLPPTAAG